MVVMWQGDGGGGSSCCWWLWSPVVVDVVQVDGGRGRSPHIPFGQGGWASAVGGLSLLVELVDPK